MSEAARKAASPDDLLGALRMIAERAGDAIMEVYNAGEGIEVETKADDSPVTAADLAADKVILEMLGILSPDIPVVTEERAWFMPRRSP